MLTFWGQVVGLRASLMRQGCTCNRRLLRWEEGKVTVLFSSSDCTASGAGCLSLSAEMTGSSNSPGRSCWQIWSQRVSCFGDQTRQRHSFHCAQEVTLASPLRLLLTFCLSQVLLPQKETLPTPPPPPSSSLTRMGASAFALSFLFRLED